MSKRMDDDERTTPNVSSLVVVAVVVLFVGLLGAGAVAGVAAYGLRVAEQRAAREAEMRARLQVEQINEAHRREVLRQSQTPQPTEP